MKAGIHPNYKRVMVKCACGNEFESGSGKDEVRVEICSECHPFYTGGQKFGKADGRVERFNKNTVSNPKNAMVVHIKQARELLEACLFFCANEGLEKMNIFGEIQKHHSQIAGIRVR